MIQDLRPHIRALADRLIDGLAGRGGADFLADFAAPLPARLIAGILGIPEAEAADFAAKVYTMTRGLGSFRDEDLPEIETAASGLIGYVERQLADRRRAPRDDFLSTYIARVDEDGALDETETLIQIVSVIIGGSDTTRFGLTSTLSQLLQRPDQWEALRADPALAPGAVLEGLRFEPPVGSIGRVVTQPVEIDGVLLTPGSLLSLSFVSGQRDETVFSDPHAFDIARRDHPRWSLSFGHGAHRCVGEALARAEMEEALIALSQRLPDLRLAGDPPTPKGHSGIRGITAMPVAWG
jgi:cytochrome P450